MEQSCQKPVCEICVTEEHHQHSTPGIDEFIEGKKRDISLQTARFRNYIDKLAKLTSRLAESLITVEANISNDSKFRHKYSAKNRLVEIMQKLKLLIELVKKHENEVQLIMMIPQEIKGETETFTSLSLVTKYFQKCKEAYEVDCRIRALLHTLREPELQDSELSIIIQSLIDSKDEAFYPHLNLKWNTGLDFYSHEYHFLCHGEDGSIIVAGITRRVQYKIIRYSRFGEILWVRNQPEKWDQVDDMIEFQDSGKRPYLLCCNIRNEEISIMSIESSGKVEDKFKHESIVPGLLAFSTMNQILYIFDMTTEPPRICVLDTSTFPFQLLRFFPLPAAYAGSNEMLYLAESRLLLLRAYTFKNPCLAAIKEDSGEIVWEYRDEFRGSGISLSPNGLILTAAVNSVLCLDQAGKIIHEYEFEKSGIIVEPKWFQGFLIMLHTVESLLTVKTVMTPCPDISRGQKVKT